MATIVEQARQHAASIRRGTLLAIDPASGGTSQPGWAAWQGGKFLKSGTLRLPTKKNIQYRLRALYELLITTQPDVVVVERIRGKMAHEFLRWSVGVIIAATCPKVILEMPVSTWKKHAGKDHVKSDEADAVAIGECLLHLARAKAA